MYPFKYPVSLNWDISYLLHFKFKNSSDKIGQDSKEVYTRHKEKDGSQTFPFKVVKVAWLFFNMNFI